MGPSALDLFILTFNCAKTLINVPVFAAHLQDALTRNGTAGQLPDLVVFSLQEFAPLSYSFIGGYFLSPYLARFEEALNLAAAQVSSQLPAPSTTTSGESSSSSSEADPFLPPDQPTPSDNNDGKPPTTTRSSSSSSLRGPYQLMRSHNAGMTAIMLFARDPAAVRSLQAAEVGFGAADMGNKGAAGLRVTVAGREREEEPDTELTFVATHLAAMEWNLRRRNKNWRSIVSDLTFANPKDVIRDGGLEGLGTGPRGRKRDSAASPPLEEEEFESEDDNEDGPLLTLEQEARRVLTHDEKLRGISVFRPTSHLFVAGDLNYRIGAETPPPLADFPSHDPGSPHYWPKFLERDQLTQEREAGRTLHGLAEARIGFPPTYKLDIVPSGEPLEGAANEAEVRADTSGLAVPFTYAAHRWPSWCDRILFLGGAAGEAAVDVRAYAPLPVVRTSDHQAVYLRARVPRGLLSAPPAEEGDPRASLPVPLDVDAWQRRAAARRKEVLVGWSMFFWSTKEGAVVIGTAALVAVGAWAVWHGVY